MGGEQTPQSDKGGLIYGIHKGWRVCMGEGDVNIIAGEKKQSSTVNG